VLEINKSYLGDYKDYLKDIPQVDCIITDIPYNISRENNFKTMQDRKGRIGIIFGQWDYNFDVNSLCKLQSLLKEGGSLIVFHSFEQFTQLQNIFSELEFKDKIIWEKTNPMPRNRDRRYISNIEIGSWFIKKGKWTFNRQSKYHGCVFRYPSESGGGFKRYHPTQKNLELIKKLVKIHTNSGDLVLDPLSGSATTLVACKQLSRNFIGIEKDKTYFDRGSERLLNTLLPLDVNTKEDGFPPTPKGMGIQPTIL